MAKPAGSLVRASPIAESICCWVAPIKGTRQIDVKYSLGVGSARESWKTLPILALLLKGPPQAHRP
jgi:hypothetical protein